MLSQRALSVGLGLAILGGSLLGISRIVVGGDSQAPASATSVNGRTAEGPSSLPLVTALTNQELGFTREIAERFASVHRLSRQMQTLNRELLRSERMLDELVSNYRNQETTGVPERTVKERESRFIERQDVITYEIKKVSQEWEKIVPEYYQAKLELMLLIKKNGLSGLDFETTDKPSN